MKPAERADNVARDAILKLLSDDELAKVSNAESAYQLADGDEYIDLRNLSQGVQISGSASPLTMGHVLPRRAVRDETWNRIVAQLGRGARVAPASSRPSPATRARPSLFENREFKIHFAIYVAVNALLIALNLWATPGKIWAIWPLLGWGIGIAAHAFGVLRSSPSSRSLR